MQKKIIIYDENENAIFETTRLFITEYDDGSQWNNTFDVKKKRAIIVEEFPLLDYIFIQLFRLVSFVPYVLLQKIRKKHFKSFFEYGVERYIEFYENVQWILYVNQKCLLEDTYNNCKYEITVVDEVASITGLRVKCYIEFRPEDRKLRQCEQTNIQIAVSEGEIEQNLNVTQENINYKELCQFLRQMENEDIKELLRETVGEQAEKIVSLCDELQELYDKKNDQRKLTEIIKSLKAITEGACGSIIASGILYYIGRIII